MEFWNFLAGGPPHTPAKKLHIRPFLLKQIGVGGCYVDMIPERLLLAQKEDYFK